MDEKYSVFIGTNDAGEKCLVFIGTNDTDREMPIRIYTEFDRKYD